MVAINEIFSLYLNHKLEKFFSVLGLNKNQDPKAVQILWSKLHWKYWDVYNLKLFSAQAVILFHQCL